MHIHEQTYPDRMFMRVETIPADFRWVAILLDRTSGEFDIGISQVQSRERHNIKPLYTSPAIFYNPESS